MQKLKLNCKFLRIPIVLSLDYFFSVNSLKVNRKVKIKAVIIKENTDDDPIFCVVMGRHGIIKKYSFKPNQGSMVYDISFVATSEMAPAVEILIYYIHYWGEIIFDKLELNFDSEIPNNVSI